jgi:hypothetical protein
VPLIASILHPVPMAGSGRIFPASIAIPVNESRGGGKGGVSERPLGEKGEKGLVDSLFVIVSSRLGVGGGEQGF